MTLFVNDGIRFVLFCNCHTFDLFNLWSIVNPVFRNAIFLDQQMFWDLFGMCVNVCLCVCVCVYVCIKGSHYMEYFAHVFELQVSVFLQFLTSDCVLQHSCQLFQLGIICKCFKCMLSFIKLVSVNTEESLALNRALQDLFSFTLNHQRPLHYSFSVVCAPI